MNILYHIFARLSNENVMLLFFNVFVNGWVTKKMAFGNRRRVCPSRGTGLFAIRRSQTTDVEEGLSLAGDRPPRYVPKDVSLR